MIPAPDIPGHTVLGVLGSGGFATVYRTWQIAVGRETAVKVDSRVLHTERDQRRFIREVTAAGRLSGHPHVIDVYDAGTLRDGRPYLVMELCPDGSLSDELYRNGPISAELACHIGTNLADALAAAHDAGILHRDIKPANILINRFGVVGLADFGLASMIAASGEQSVSREALTPAYAPPESFEAAEPTAVADVYSLAATLYALMAGRPPRFPADMTSPSLAAILALHSQPVDDIPGVPVKMLDVLRQCLAADPALRLPSAAALRDELAGLLGAQRGPAQAPPPAHRQPLAPRSVPLPEAAPVAYGEPATGHQRSASQRSSPAPPGTRTTAAGQGAHATGHGRRRPAIVLAAAAGAAVLLLAAGALIVDHRLLGPATNRTPGAAGGFGIETTTSNCPAASVPGAGARCPQAPECWNGLDEGEGVITVRSLPCGAAHTWQTFAIGIMPAGAAAFNVHIVRASPTVRAVCSASVLLRSRTGRARLVPPGRWRIQVLPPDEVAYDSGVRTYRCLASLGYGAASASQFGP